MRGVAKASFALAGFTAASGLVGLVNSGAPLSQLVAAFIGVVAGALALAGFYNAIDSEN